MVSWLVGASALRGREHDARARSDPADVGVHADHAALRAEHASRRLHRERLSRVSRTLREYHPQYSYIIFSFIPYKLATATIKATTTTPPTPRTPTDGAQARPPH
jgi:hypothetical protein